MTIKIYEGDSEKTVKLVCNDQRFIREFGNSQIDCSTKGIYQNLHMICSWGDTTLHEKCYFEVV